MLARTIDAITTSMANSNVAQNPAELVGGTAFANEFGGMSDEFEVNDYPQIARQRITHREPLLAIEEMTGARLWVKGQYFADNAKVPDGARRLYVEITGPSAI